MYVMLYLDLTGGNTIKNCESRGCPNYFRVGPQSKSRYCSERCANRTSTNLPPDPRSGILMCPRTLESQKGGSP